MFTLNSFFHTVRINKANGGGKVEGGGGKKMIKFPMYTFGKKYKNICIV